MTNEPLWYEQEDIVTGHEDDAEAVDVAMSTQGPPVDRPERRPVFAAVVSKPDTRRPIVPAGLRRGNLVPTAKNVAGGVGHRLGYHALRSPFYLLVGTFWAIVGVFRLSTRQISWWWFMEQYPLRQGAATAGDGSAHSRMHKEAKATRLFRGYVLLGELAAILAAALLLWFVAPRWAAVLVVAVAVPVLAHVGRPLDRPIVTAAVVKPQFRRLTAELVRAAIVACRIPGIKEPSDVNFPQDIHRDGPGQMAIVDLPAGVDAVEVIKRRSELASGLRVPVDQVWPEPVPKAHPGRLALWVGYEPASAMQQPAWPLLSVTEPLDVFKPFPLGTDPRLRSVMGSLMYRNWLIGAMPGYGKTFALRLPLLAAALDPTVELRGYELKGTGDLDMLEPLCAEFGSGADDDTALRALELLRWLRAECVRRGPIIKRMAAAGKAPDNKVTRQLATALRELRTLVAFIDECQELFSHAKYGQEAGELAASIIKLGRALGVILLLATQRPDAKSLPTDVSANAGVRLCLRVMGQTENDMVLGTSKYKEGIRATIFGDEDYGWGWLVGLGKPVTLRGYKVDGPAAKKVAAKALAFRQGAGTVDVAPRERVKSYNLLEDVRAVWVEGEDALWSELLLPRLEQLRPEVYGGWDVAAFGAAMKAAGVPTVSIHRKVEGKGTTRYGVKLVPLVEALQGRQVGS